VKIAGDSLELGIFGKNSTPGMFCSNYAELATLMVFKFMGYKQREEDILVEKWI